MNESESFFFLSIWIGKWILSKARRPIPMSINSVIPDLFWHQGPVFVEDNFSRDQARIWFQDDLSTSHFLCTLFIAQLLSHV